MTLTILLVVLGCAGGNVGTDDTATTTTGTDDTAVTGVDDSGEDTGSDTDTDTDTDTPDDADGDGYSVPDDCNDDDSAVNPGAPEYCNGQDDDCDLVIDEPDAIDAPTWYLDEDGDGYGIEEVSTTACSAPHGYVAQAGDCDDQDARYHPGAAEEDCTDPRDYNCDGSTGWEDADGDGAAACEDCDDSSTFHFPGAGERCDGTDEDCDGIVDEDVPGAPTWYGDADGDGYGGSTFTEEACEAPFSYVDNTDDCDDLVNSIHPGAEETCDDVDQDCDGTVDEDAADLSTWYSDSDSDGYGDPDSTKLACDAPTDHVDNADDCDDGDGSVSPAGTEVCGGADEDCDGSTDESGADDASTWYADLDGDGYGSSRFSTGACEAPSGYVADDQDCDDLDADSFPGADEICDGDDQDCDSVVDEDAIDPADWYGDRDGDGYGDAASTTTACDAPTDHVDNADDCDDSDAGISPVADELCDGVDNDCDGAEDEADALDATVYYADLDGDGFGDAGDTEIACDPPAGFVTDDTDCDDGDADLNPDATELCDGIDDDCDETIDEDASDAATWYADSDGDGYGTEDATIQACSQPSGYESTAGDCDDEDAETYDSAPGLCDGVDRDCDGTVTADEAPGESSRCYGLSCLEILDTRGETLADGLYWIDPTDGDAAFEAWCDMTTDGGGYTMLKVDQGSTYYGDDAESDCSSMGLQLFIPRTQAHLLSAWTVALDTATGGSATSNYLYIMGVYPATNGATCESTPLNSDNASCDWVAGDLGAFWVSDSSSITEPNGDNDILSSMYYAFDSSGTVTSYNDLNYPGYGSSQYICSALDE
jgi:hypothetical protein